MINLLQNDQNFHNLLPEAQTAAQKAASIEDRIHQLQDLHLSTEELTPFRENVQNICNRKITIAKELVVELKQYKKERLLHKLKMLGTAIGIILLGLTAIAALAGIAFGLTCLLKTLVPFLGSFSVILSVLASCGIGVLSYVAFRAKIVNLIIVGGNALINNVAPFMQGIQNLKPKVNEYQQLNNDWLRLAKETREQLPQLVRLSDPAVLNAVVYDYVKYHIIRHGSCDRFLSGEVSKEDLLESIKADIEVGVNKNFFDGRVFKSIREYDQLQLQSAKATPCLVRILRMPKVLAGLISSYMTLYKP